MTFVNHLVQRTLALGGLEMRRINRSVPTARGSLLGALEHVRRLGFRPHTVIDAGVADGTPELYKTFPEAHYILIEPLAEFVPAFRRIKESVASLEYHTAAASS